LSPFSRLAEGNGAPHANTGQLGRKCMQNLFEPV
jgi:hypothetical protein